MRMLLSLSWLLEDLLSSALRGRIRLLAAGLVAVLAVGVGLARRDDQRVRDSDVARDRLNAAGVGRADRRRGTQVEIDWRRAARSMALRAVRVQVTASALGQRR